MSQPNVGEESLALGIDVGTTSVKIAVIARIEGGGVKVECHAEKDTKVGAGNGVSKSFVLKKQGGEPT